MTKKQLRVPTSKLRVQKKEVEGRITTKGRRGLAKTSFAVPDGKEPGQKGRYPIDTVERARNALARSAQAVKAGRMSASQRASIVRKVHSKYPNIEIG